MKEVRFHPQLWLVTRGTASHGQQMRQVLTLPLVGEARLALPAPGTLRVRNGRHLVLHSHLQVTKVSSKSIAFYKHRSVLSS